MNVKMNRLFQIVQILLYRLIVQCLSYNWYSIFFHFSKIDVVMFSVSPGHVHIALCRRIKFRMSLKIPSNSNYKSLRLTYENHNWSPTNFISLTLKIIYARFSVSPGHISDAIYIQMKCKISIEILPNNNYIYLRMIYENRKGQQLILFRETPKLNFVMFSVSLGHFLIVS